MLVAALEFLICLLRWLTWVCVPNTVHTAYRVAMKRIDYLDADTALDFEHVVAPLSSPSDRTNTFKSTDDVEERHGLYLSTAACRS
jgi:hypothetical protein